MAAAAGSCLLQQGKLSSKMMAQNTQSSQSFVRALKAPSDPPHAGGQSKIELAREAWDNTEFYVPNKGVIIADWLLSKLLKDKDREM